MLADFVDGRISMVIASRRIVKKKSTLVLLRLLSICFGGHAPRYRGSEQTCMGKLLGTDGGWEVDSNAVIKLAAHFLSQQRKRTPA